MKNEVITIKISQACGTHCVGIEEGSSLFEKMSSELKSGATLLLDFGGVLTLTSSFLSASVGKLYGKFHAEDLDKRLKWTGIDEDDTQLLQLVIKNAKDHFAKSLKDRKIDNDITRGAIEGD